MTSLNETARDLLAFFDEHKRSAKAIVQLLDNYYDALAAQGNPNQGGVFDDLPHDVDKQSLLNKARQDYEREFGQSDAEQGDFFAGNGRVFDQFGADDSEQSSGGSGDEGGVGENQAGVGGETDGLKSGGEDGRGGGNRDGAVPVPVHDAGGVVQAGNVSDVPVREAVREDGVSAEVMSEQDADKAVSVSNREDVVDASPVAGGYEEFSYSVRKRSENSVSVTPLVGKKFTSGELDRMVELLRDEPDFLSVDKKNGQINIIAKFGYANRFDDLVSLVEERLPRALSKKKVKAIERDRENAENAKREQEDAEQFVRENADIYAFFDEYFGEVINRYNRRAIAEVINGSVVLKEGESVISPSQNWLDGLQKLGILDADKKYPKSESGGINGYQIAMELADAYHRLKSDSEAGAKGGSGIRDVFDALSIDDFDGKKTIETRFGRTTPLTKLSGLQKRQWTPVHNGRADTVMGLWLMENAFAAAQQNRDTQNSIVFRQAYRRLKNAKADKKHGAPVLTDYERELARGYLFGDVEVVRDPFFEASDIDDDGLRFSQMAANDNTDPKNLFIAHNISADGVLHANRLGGLAAPSLAVARADISDFSGYGDITLLADKSLLDDSKMPAFNADVYSPRQPKANYQIDYKKFNDLVNSLDTLEGHLNPPNFASSSGVDGAADFINSSALQYHYLKQRGKAPKLKGKKADVFVKRFAALNLSREQLEQDEAFVRYVRAQVQKQYDLRKASGNGRAVYLFEKSYFKDDGSIQDRVFSQYADNVLQYRLSGGMDYAALRDDVVKVMRSPKLADEYRKWAVAEFDRLVEGRRFVDGYTQSGNPRYRDYTLDNLVSAMTRSIRNGEGFAYASAGSVRSAYAKELKSLREVRESRNNIVSPEVFAVIKEQSERVLDDALEKLKPFYRFDSGSWMYRQDAASALGEGMNGVKEAFRLTAESRKIVADLTDYLANLPTEYFEVKAQRAVQFSEFKTAVVPKNVDKEVKRILKDAGLTVRTYDPDVKGDRQRVIAGQEKLLFSQSAMKSVEANIGRGRAAMNRAIVQKADVKRAMYRNDIGWIDFVWGSVGKTLPNGRTRGAMGIAHILEARQRKDGMSRDDVVKMLTENVVETIARGNVHKHSVLDNSERLQLRFNGYEANLTKNKGSNAWLITGYELYQNGASRVGFDTSAATHALPTPARQNMGASDADNLRPAVDVVKIRAAVNDALGDLAGRVHLVADVETALPQHAKRILAGGYDGAFDAKSGKVYLFAENLTPERAAFVAWHELGHRGYADGQFADYRSELRRFGQHSVVAKLADAVVADRKGVPDDPVHQNRDIALEEALAELYAANQTGNWDALSERYGVEMPRVLQRHADGLMARVLAALRAFADKVFGRGHSDADLVGLLRDLHRDVTGAAVSGGLSQAAAAGRQGNRVSGQKDTQGDSGRRNNADVQLDMAIAKLTPSENARKQIEQTRELVRRAVGDEHMARVKVVSRVDVLQHFVGAKKYDLANGLKIAKSARGWFDSHSGRVFLVAENFKRPELAAFTAWHELGHAKVAVSGRQEWRAVLRDAYRGNALLHRVADMKRNEAHGKYANLDVAIEEALVEMFAALKTGNYAEFKSRYGVNFPVVPTRNFLQRVLRALQAVARRVLGRPVAWDNDALLSVLKRLDGVDLNLRAKAGDDAFAFDIFADEADKIMRALDKMGVRYSSDASRLSDSKYVHVLNEDESEIVFKVRISDHALPLKYKFEHGFPDFEVKPKHGRQLNSRGEDATAHTGGYWTEAVAAIADVTGKPMPKYVQNLFDKEMEVKRREEEARKRHAEQMAQHAEKMKNAKADKRESQLVRVADDLEGYREKLAYLDGLGDVGYRRTGSRKTAWIILPDGTELLAENYYPKAELMPATFDLLKKELRDLIGEAERSVSFDLNEEADSEFAKAVDDYDRMKANGETELTFKQWQQVRSPEFKAWFGDWENDPENASKVVNPKTGEPLVVYHATDAEFTIFDIAKLGGLTYGNAQETAIAMSAGIGHWFNLKNLNETLGYGDRAVAAFLNIRSPEYYSDLDGLFAELSDFVPQDDDGRYKSRPSDFDDLAEITEHAQKYVAYLKDSWIDGVAVKNDTEFGGSSYVAFDSNQIKSAVDNVGTFDADNDDIRFDMGDDVESGADDAEFARKAAVLQGKPVYVVKERKAPRDNKLLKQWATRLFEQAGGKAVNPEIGEVVLNEKSVKDSMAHGMNADKAMAFEAVPSVIEKGVVVAQVEHGEMTSYYISAPVVIQERDDMVTVLVRKDVNTQKMYLHSVTTKENLLNAAPIESIADTGVSKPHGKLHSGDVANILRSYLNFKPDNAGSAKQDDGVSFDMAEADTPQQRSSAMGNLIRSVSYAGSMNDLMRSAGGKWTDFLKIGLQSLGRRQIVDIYGRLLPQLKDYDNLVDRFAADGNKTAIRADDLVIRWGSLKDGDALADLMHEATIAQIDADPLRQDKVKGARNQAKAAHLKARFEKLSPEAQAVYRQARDDYREQFDAVRDAMMGRLKRMGVRVC